MQLSAESAVAPRLSVVIPAYNEGTRLGPFLASSVAYLDGAFGREWEIVVVDDGSSDDTSQVVERMGRGGGCVRLVRHHLNRGKGAAVRTGVEHARGAYVLFADADGATPIEEEVRLRRLLDAGADGAIGSREARVVRGASDLPLAVERQPRVARAVRLHRYLAGRVFATTVRVLMGLDYLDTQCGFKMFRLDTAHTLFPRVTEEGYIFDVEVLYLARLYGYVVPEVPVNWHEVSGSKVRLVRDAVRMVLGMLRIRAAGHRSPQSAAMAGPAPTTRRPESMR